jgi:hypothetical protein
MDGVGSSHHWHIQIFIYSAPHRLVNCSAKYPSSLTLALRSSQNCTNVSKLACLCGLLLLLFTICSFTKNSSRSLRACCSVFYFILFTVPPTGWSTAVQSTHHHSHSRQDHHKTAQTSQNWPAYVVYCCYYWLHSLS